MRIFGVRRITILLTLGLMFFFGQIFADDWNFKLKSKVELRSWRLSSVAMKSSTVLNGASVKLYNGSAVVSESMSDANGNFEMNIPSSGNYTLLITYQGYEPKKFIVSTKGNSDNNDPNFKPSVNIVGMMPANYKEEGKYLGLDQPHVRLDYTSAEKGIEKKEPENKFGYNFKLNMYDAEYLHIQRFCTANKLGDMAMNRKDYELAKKFYLMAMNRMDKESYPIERLKLAEEGLKLEKETKESARIKQKSVKSTSKKAVATSPAKTMDYKKSSEGGKGRGKIRQTLGK